MSLLLPNALPSEVEGLAVYASFRNMVQLELLMQDDEIPAGLKTHLALNLLYKTPPQNPAKALNGLLWFYTCGQGQSTAAPQKLAEPAYCFKQDAPLIYAAFYSAYGINLARTPFLHWWEFSALFTALPEDTRFMQVVAYRTAELDGMEPNQKAHYQTMKQRYALARRTPPGGTTPAAQDAALKQWAAQRFKLANSS